MKKLFIVFLIAIVLYSCNNQQKIIDRLTQHDWITTNSTPIQGSIYTIDPGLLMSFKSKNALFKHVHLDTLVTYSFHLDDDIIFLNNDVFGKVVYISKDSLIINFENGIQTKCFPVESNNIHIENQSLIDNEWICQTGNDKKSLFIFTNVDWTISYNRFAKFCLEQNLNGKYRTSIHRRWNLVNFDNYCFLTISQETPNPLIYHLKSKSADSFIFENFTNDQNPIVLLKKIPKLHKNEIDSIFTLVSNKTWVISDIIDYANKFSEDTLLKNIKASGFTHPKNILFEEKSLFKKQISFKFNRDLTYQIYQRKKTAISGTWELSQSGKLIILDKGNPNSQIINVIEITEGSIIIGKSDKFSIEKEKKGIFTEYYYKVRLKHNNG